MDDLRQRQLAREQELVKLLADEQSKSQKLYLLTESLQGIAKEQMDNFAKMRRSGQVETK